MTSLFFCNVAAVFAIATNPTNPSSITRNDTVSCNVVLSATPSNCNELSISNDLYNNINVLSSFSELQENWDVYGAQPLSNSLILKVKGVLACLENQPEVFPTGRGSIQLEYERDNGSYLEFECYDDGHVSVLHIDFEGNECESVINFEQIREMVDEFYG